MTREIDVPMLLSTLSPQGRGRTPSASARGSPMSSIAIVIGAGANELVAAHYLWRRSGLGWRVTPAI